MLRQGFAAELFIIFQTNFNKQARLLKVFLVTTLVWFGEFSLSMQNSTLREYLLFFITLFGFCMHVC